LEQNSRRRLLVYGNQHKTTPNTIDVTERQWHLNILNEEEQFYCTKEAYIVAIRVLGSSRLGILDDETWMAEETPIAAARINDIVVSPTYNETAGKAKVWLSSYHLEVIKQILGKGFKVELVDGSGKVIRQLDPH